MPYEFYLYASENDDGREYIATGESPGLLMCELQDAFFPMFRSNDAPCPLTGTEWVDLVCDIQQHPNGGSFEVKNGFVLDIDADCE